MPYDTAARNWCARIQWVAAMPSLDTVVHPGRVVTADVEEVARLALDRRFVRAAVLRTEIGAENRRPAELDGIAEVAGGTATGSLFDVAVVAHRNCLTKVRSVAIDGAAASLDRTTFGAPRPITIPHLRLVQRARWGHARAGLAVNLRTARLDREALTGFASVHLVRVVRARRCGKATSAPTLATLALCFDRDAAGCVPREGERQKEESEFHGRIEALGRGLRACHRSAASAFHGPPAFRNRSRVIQARDKRATLAKQPGS